MRPRRLTRVALAAAIAATVVLALREFGLFEPGRLTRGVRNVGVFAGDLWPPASSGEVVGTLLHSLLETIEMAWAGTVLGAFFALPLAVLAARPLAPTAIAVPVRALLAAVRTIPSLLWAVFFVVIVGLGPLAGVLALAMYTCGYLGKLYYEAFEAVDPDLLDASRATGASRVQVARHAVIPEAGNALVSQGLFAFEYNVRASSVLGLVGAGGIGFHIVAYVDRLQYERVATALLLLLAVVIAIDGASRALRKRFLADARRT